jgi:hypothetical protein
MYRIPAASAKDVRHNPFNGKQKKPKAQALYRLQNSA